MSIRRKTWRRLSILFGVLILILGLGAGGYLYRQHQLDQRSIVAKGQGLVAYDAGEYQKALRGLGGYLKRFPDDLDILYKFALARKEVPVEKGAHLLASIDILVNIKYRQPDMLEAQYVLLELYEQIGRGPETLKLANEILAKDPDNPEALWGRVFGLESAGRNEEALEAGMVYVAREPESLKGQLQVIGQLARSGKSQEEVIEYAESLLAGRPESQVRQLLFANTLSFTGDSEKAGELLKELAEGELVDRDFTGVLVVALSRAGMSGEVRAVMQRSAEADPKSPYRRSLVLLEWDEGNFEAAVSRVKSLEESGEELTTELLAVQLLCLSRLERLEEAREVLASHRDRLKTPEEQAWRRFFEEVLLASNLPAAKRIETCIELTEAYPAVPYFHFTLGQLQEEVGENVLAIGGYLQASRLRPGWGDALIRAARLCAYSGFVGDAALLARSVNRLGDQRFAQEIEEIIAMVRQRVLPGAKREQLDLLDGVLKEASSDVELNLPLKVELAAEREEFDVARQQIDAAVASEQAPGPEVLLRLARASNVYKLERTTECLDRYREAYGVTPEVSYFHAILVEREEGLEQALALLDNARQRAENPGEPEWDFARVALLDSSSDPRAIEAIEAWKAVSRGENIDLRVLKGLLSSKMAWEDHDLIDETIERVKAITGEGGLAWRLAWTRLSITPEPGTDPAAWRLSAEDAAEVSDQLGYILVRAPHLSQLRPILATAMEVLGDHEGAVEQLVQAKNLGPYQRRADLELARLSYQQGDYDAVRERLEKFIAKDGATNEELSKVATAPELIAAAKRLLLLNELETVERILNQGDAEWWGEEARNRLKVLARVYAAQGRIDDAEAVLAEIQAEPDLDLLRFAADLYQLLGRTDDARQQLEMMETLDDEAYVREYVIAEHYWNTGQPEEAIRHYEASVLAKPEQRPSWLRLLSIHLLAGSSEDALQVLGRAQEGWPEDDGWIGALAKESERLKECAENERLRVFASEWVLNPVYHEAALEVLELLAAADIPAGEGDSALSRQVGLVAEANPRFYELQLLAMKLFQDVQELDSLLNIARQARLNFPTKGEPSRITAEFLALNGQDEEAIQAANEWLGRTQVDVPLAHVVIAECRLRLGDAKLAIDEVSALFPESAEFVEQTEITANDDPVLAAHRRVLGVYAQALVVAGEFERVEKEILPLIVKDDFCRQHFLALAGYVVTDPGVGIRWLLEAMKRIKTPNSGERFQLARGWSLQGERARAAGRERDAILCETQVTNQVSLLEKLDDLEATDWFRIGAFREWLREPHAAEKAYRTALELKADHPLVMNNLAMILGRRGEFKEAEALARKVVTNFQNEPEYRDTLAQILLWAERHEEALRELEKCRELQPTNPRWPISMIELLMKLDPDEPRISRLRRALETEYERPFKPALEIRFTEIRNKLKDR